MGLGELYCPREWQTKQHGPFPMARSVALQVEHRCQDSAKDHTLFFSWKRWKRSLIINRYSMLVHSAYPRTRHQSFQGDSWVSWSKKLKQPYLLCCTATRSDCQFSQKSKSLSQAPAADASPDGGQAASMYVLPPASSLHFPPLPC